MCWYLLGEKKTFYAMPINMILVPLSGLFSKFPTSTPVLFVLEYPQGVT